MPFAGPPINGGRKTAKSTVTAEVDNALVVSTQKTEDRPVPGSGVAVDTPEEAIVRGLNAVPIGAYPKVECSPFRIVVTGRRIGEHGSLEEHTRPPFLSSDDHRAVCDYGFLAAVGLQAVLK